MPTCNQLLFLWQYPATIAEVNQLLKVCQFAELREVMMRSLSFGTAGNIIGWFFKKLKLN